MKVFVAGASGAIGRPLMRRLVAAGHEVTGTTRREERAKEMRAAGANAVVCDVFDAAALEAAVRAAGPEVVVNELTSLPQDYNPARPRSTSRPTGCAGGRRQPDEAALAAGARRYVTPEHRLPLRPGRRLGQGRGGAALRRRRRRHSATAVRRCRPRARGARSEGIEGLVLRYGQFYGPGTYYDRGGSIGRQVAEAGFPIVGRGPGSSRSSMSRMRPRPPSPPSTTAPPASTTSPTTSPRRCSEWLPVYAEALGAKPPRMCPPGWRRIVGGRDGGRIRRSSSAAPRMPRRSGSWAGSRATRAGGRASQEALRESPTPAPCPGSSGPDRMTP